MLGIINSDRHWTLDWKMSQRQKILLEYEVSMIKKKKDLQTS